MKKRVGVAFLCATWLAACSHPNASPPHEFRYIVPNNSCADQSAPSAVSIVRLVANPELFVGRCVMVDGYLWDNSLFVSADHAKIFDRESAVGLVDRTEKAAFHYGYCTKQYVTVVGTFKKAQDASYEIDDITRLYAFGSKQPEAECWDAPDN